ncbi:MAG: uridine diphosphate-N-acetylglucosamine-binding protein YvcK [Actinomycetes bacterium]
MSDVEAINPKVVALGGGHGLAASLSALRRVTDQLTAVVTVADDGGSSGRLRRDLGVLPPGDLRMALAALCEDDDWGRTWSRVVQHRFQGPGDLSGHSVGNLLIVALWELAADDPVHGLDWVGRLLKASGRVLPMSTVPLDIEAIVEDGAGDRSTVRGQVAVATTSGRIVDVALIPDMPPACPEAVTAITEADWLILGPGSWFTSVIPHLLVPELAAAITTTASRRAVVLNLEPQVGETTGFTPEAYLESLERQAPELAIDVVMADASCVAERATLESAASRLGAELAVVEVKSADDPARHDPLALAAAFGQILTAPRRPSRVIE